jgi:hypothetical protein
MFVASLMLANEPGSTRLRQSLVLSTCIWTDDASSGIVSYVGEHTLPNLELFVSCFGKLCFLLWQGAALLYTFLLATYGTVAS